MNPDIAGNGLYLIIALVLVGTAFFGRRMAFGQTVKLLLVWAAIFGIGFVALSFRHDVANLFNSRVLGNATIAGDTVRIPMADDGHFYVDARINGAPVRLMVDSGASVTTLSRSTAIAAAVQADGLVETVITANGPLTVARAQADTFSVGNIAMRDLTVHLAPTDDFNVIGMNFLSKLSRWTVEGRTLILTT